jgi:hypothetical protein
MYGCAVGASAVFQDNKKNFLSKRVIMVLDQSRTVSKCLGHANMTTTGTYTHTAFRAQTRGAAETLGDILSLGSKKQEKKA